MFPLMLYLDGVKLDQYRVVNDEAEQAQAETEGYQRLNLAAAKGLEPEASPVKRGPGRPRKNP